MAFFSSSEEPLIESETQDALARRGAETVGLILIAAGLLVALMLGTFDPKDPSAFNATNAPPQNLLGLPGAVVADILHRFIGWAAWGIPVTLWVWGLRFVLHKGERRLIGRIILAPLAVLVGAVFASAHAPLEGWAHGYGLGGWFGDAVLGGILSGIPADLGVSLVAVTLLLLVGLVVIGTLALGVTWDEAYLALALAVRGIWMILRLGWRAIRGLFGVSYAAYRGHRARTGAINPADEDPELYRARLMRGYGREAPDEVHVEPEVTSEEPAAAPPGPSLSRRRRKIEMPEEVVTADEIGTDDDEALMSRITAAVAAHERASGADEAGALGGVTRDNPVPEADETYDADLEEDPEDETFGTLDLPPVAPEAAHRAEVAQKVRAERPRALRKSMAAKAEEQPRLALGDETREEYLTPPLALLEDPANQVKHVPSSQALEENARMLENVLDDYGVKGEIVSVRPGPVVTMYELEPAPGLKASRVIGLSDDIARSMSALTTRVSTVPGRSVIGIELPNAHREKVMLREMFASAAYGDTRMRLPLALGKDIAGEPVVANLAKMPHLLIAGTTGSGKSVAINTMILSLLYQLSPDECRMIMIDPKMLELSVYDGIPHLLSPVVTDPKKAVVALKWTVAEMEERYRKMSKMGVRNIDGYNAKVRDALSKGEDFSRTVQTGFDEDTGEPIFETETFQPETMPFIVVIVDEMADLMMVAGKEIEACIQRLAQMARASGIHIVMATQRPSVDVITGTIKANFPTRISFQVTSKVDSRTILGEQGAEQLLGMGDMLYMAGGGRVQRVHGPFVSDEEVEEIVAHLKSLGTPEYVSGVVEGPEDAAAADIDQVLGLGGNTTGEDALYDQAVAIVARDRKCSTSYIQRKLGIGYNKAARLVEQMEDEGVVSQANHVGKREVLVPEAA